MPGAAPSPTSAREIPIGTAFIFVVFGAVGIAVSAGHVLSAAWVRFAYQPAEAKVLEKQVAERSVRGGTRYVLKARLDFAVGDREYQGWVTLPRESRQREGPEAQAVANQVQVGQRLRCFHDPVNPASGVVLDRGGLNGAMLIGSVVPALFLSIGVAGLVAKRRRSYPGGMGTDARGLVARLPRAFFAAALGVPIVALVGWWILQVWGASLGAWAVLVVLATITGASLLLVVAARMARVALPSPERTAALAGEPRQRSIPTRLGLTRVEKSDVDREVFRPVRLKPYGGSDLPFGAVLGIFAVVASTGFVLAGLFEAQRGGAPRARLRWTAAAITLSAASAAFLGWRRLRGALRGLEVELKGYPLRPGGRIPVAIRHPDPAKLRRMRIALICEEVARSPGARGGENVQRRIGSRLATKAEDGQREHSPPRFCLNLPCDAVPTFKTEKHQIDWFLAVTLTEVIPWTVRYRVKMRPPESRSRRKASAESAGARLDDGPLSLWIDQASKRYWPVEMVSGGCEVRPADDGAPLRSAELSVLWYTTGAGTGELGVLHYEGRESTDAHDVSLFGTRRFRVQLPPQPFSFEGKLFKVRWAVRARLRYVDGREILRELPFLVGPHGATDKDHEHS